MTRRSNSAFSCRAFPDDVIALAVRWYVRYRLSYAEVCEWVAERGILVDRSTIYRWVQRFLPLFGEVARRYREPVGPDWRVDETTLGSATVGSTSRERSRWVWSDLRCVCVGDARYGCRPQVLQARHRLQGTTPRRVITDKAASYPPALAVAVPGLLHRTGRSYERDRAGPRVCQGQAAAMARAQVRCVKVDLYGHALIRNIRRRFYRLVESVPQRMLLAWTWNRLAEPL